MNFKCVENEVSLDQIKDGIFIKCKYPGEVMWDKNVCDI